MLLQSQHERVARLAGDISGASREAIEDIIHASNRHAYILHGHKYRSDIPDGVKPVTPEGHCSYWNSGSRIFGVLEDERLLTEDSVVFNYAHCRNPGMNRRRMHVIIANYRDLKDAGLRAVDDFKPDDYVTFTQTVPASLLHQIQIEVETSPHEVHEREHSQACERALIEMLHDTLFRGYSPGTVEIHRLREAQLQMSR